MPRALEGGGTFPYVLKSDIGKDNPPTFQIRVLVKRLYRQLMNAYRDFREATDTTKRDEKLDECTGIAIAGWSNMGQYKYGEHRCEEFLTEDEILEILGHAIKESYTSVEDKKKSESQCSSETDSPAVLAETSV